MGLRLGYPTWTGLDSALASGAGSAAETRFASQGSFMFASSGERSSAVIEYSMNNVDFTAYSAATAINAGVTAIIHATGVYPYMRPGSVWNSAGDITASLTCIASFVGGG